MKCIWCCGEVNSNKLCIHNYFMLEAEYTTTGSEALTHNSRKHAVDDHVSCGCHISLCKPNGKIIQIFDKRNLLIKMRRLQCTLVVGLRECN